MSKKTLAKTSFHHINQYPVIIHQEETGGYWVECPVIDGCYSQGETIDEALRNIREAIELCQEVSPVKIAPQVQHGVSLHFVQA